MILIPLDFEQMELFDTTASMDVGQEQELQYTREILSATDGRMEYS